MHKMVREMRIAIPCSNNNGLESEISMHFGRSPYYAFVDVEGNKIKNGTLNQNNQNIYSISESENF